MPARENDNSFNYLSIEKKTSIDDIVHSNACSPIQVLPLGNTYYFLTFTDDASR